jgi:hypothetical protein
MIISHNLSRWYPELSKEDSEERPGCAWIHVHRERGQCRQRESSRNKSYGYQGVQGWEVQVARELYM